MRDENAGFASKGRIHWRDRLRGAKFNSYRRLVSSTHKELRLNPARLTSIRPSKSLQSTYVRVHTCKFRWRHGTMVSIPRFCF